MPTHLRCLSIVSPLSLCISASVTYDEFYGHDDVLFDDGDDLLHDPLHDLHQAVAVLVRLPLRILQSLH